MTKRVLLISPYFPPHKAIGTKRAINFVQGVHNQEGWEVIVLASQPFNDNIDHNLIDQIPDGVHVNYGFVGIFRPVIKFLSGGSKSKKPTSEPSKSLPKKDSKKKKKKGSLTPFDQYLWDVNSAIRNGKQLIKSFNPDLIWVNADPWSGFLVAHKLSRRFGIPWVADMRDPWTIFKLRMEARPIITQKLIRYFERKFFASASKVVLNTQAAMDEYKKVYPAFIAEKFTFIRNAFNENLLPDIEPVEQKEAFVFGYYGGFRPFVPSDFILKGFASFVKEKNLSSDQVKLEVTGSTYPDFWIQINKYQIEEYIVVNSAINADATISHLRSWDVLLLTAIHDLRWQMPAKFYDYLRAQKPILAVSDYNELNRLIDETRSGRWAKTDQSAKIQQLFEQFFSEGKTELLDNTSFIKPFGLESQANMFRQVLDETLASYNGK